VRGSRGDVFEGLSGVSGGGMEKAGACVEVRGVEMRDGGYCAPGLILNMGWEGKNVKPRWKSRGKLDDELSMRM